jgi:hypothetical protein
MNRKSSLHAVGSFLVASAIIAVILGYLFADSFRPNQVVFSNDGPVGVVKSEALKQPDAIKGYWVDLHWIGSNGGFSPACFTYALLWMLGPIGFAKFYPAFASLILGMSAWVFFRSIGLRASLAVIGGIAAGLNSNYFSNTCWGLGSRSLTLSCIFLALAALSSRRAGNPWLNAILAGLATGMAVVEGADNGVILSLFVGAFVVWHSFADSGSAAKGTVKSLRLALVVPFALLMATQTFISLFSIASQGAVSATADQETREQKWNFATQWSLPPAETLRVIVPGLYGYRMDTPDGGSYWGRVGEAPGAPEQMRRFSGAGEYAGVLVVLLAVFSIAASFRKGFLFEDRERKMIWFWAAMFVVAMVLSWGRFAPAFYKIVYSLPYFSSIRNPMKFMHAGHMALMILCGYGLLALGRRYLDTATATSGGVSARLKVWWAKANSFEKRWTIGMFAAVALSLLIYLLYSSGKNSLASYLSNAQLPPNTEAKQVAQFSINEVGKSFLYFAVSAGAVFLIMGGIFARERAKWAVVLLGLILTADLVSANKPWILYWDYTQKYATNPILDTLRKKPHEGRVVAPSFLVDPRALPPEKRIAQYFPSIYGVEWVQHHFQFYNIQSIDVAQDPRPPADKQAYTAAMFPKPGRYWELTNTKYVIGMAGFLDALNSQMDKGRNRFRIAERFDVVPKPGIANPSGLDDLTAVPAPDGAMALFEFTGALPRTKFFTNWQVITNGDAALKTLGDDAFDPSSTVIVSDPIPAPATTNSAPANAEIVSYNPRRIEVKVNAPAAGVLLLNDRFDKDWLATSGSQSLPILRCNFIMRGVQLPAGQHTVVFEFRPSLTGLNVSLGAIGLGGVLCVLLFFVRQKDAEAGVSASSVKPA